MASVPRHDSVKGRKWIQTTQRKAMDSVRSNVFVRLSNLSAACVTFVLKMTGETLQVKDVQVVCVDHLLSPSLVSFARLSLPPV